MSCDYLCSEHDETVKETLDDVIKITREFAEVTLSWFAWLEQLC